MPLLRPLRDYFVMRSTKWHGVLLSAATLGMTPECGVRTGTLESCAIVMRRGVCARFPAAPLRRDTFAIAHGPIAA